MNWEAALFAVSRLRSAGPDDPPVDKPAAMVDLNHLMQRRAPPSVLDVLLHLAAPFDGMGSDQGHKQGAADP